MYVCVYIVKRRAYIGKHNTENKIHFMWCVCVYVHVRDSVYTHVYVCMWFIHQWKREHNGYGNIQISVATATEITSTAHHINNILWTELTFSMHTYKKKLTNSAEQLDGMLRTTRINCATLIERETNTHTHTAHIFIFVYVSMFIHNIWCML